MFFPPTIQRLAVPRTVLHVLCWAVCVAAVVAATAPATAQDLARQIDVDGYSHDGATLITRVQLAGTADGGQPFAYGLVQLYDVAAGSVRQSYRVGEATGPPQTAWNNAGVEQMGVNILRGLRPRPVTAAALAPDGQRAVLTTVSSQTAAATTPACPRCQACTTQWRVLAFDPTAGRVYTLHEGQTASTAEQRAPTCPTVTVETFWTPDSRRVAVLRSEQRATRYDTVSLYDLGPESGGAGSTELVRPVRAVQPALLQQRREQAAASIRGAADRAAAMQEAAWAAALTGDLAGAHGYCDALVSVADRNAIDRCRTLVDGFLQGPPQLDALRRLARGRHGLPPAHLALALERAGDTEAAARIRPGPPSLEEIGILLQYELAHGATLLEAWAEAQGDAQSGPMVMDALLALDDLGRAAAWAPVGEDLDAVALSHVLWLAVAAGRAADALDYGEELLATNPHICRLWSASGLAALELGRTERARQLLQGAVACDPDDGDATWTLGRLRLQDGDITGAVHLMRAWLALSPPRVGDVQRIRRHGLAGGVVAMHEGPGLVVQRWECGGRERVRCNGTLVNASDVSISQAAVRLDGDLGSQTMWTDVGPLNPGSSRAFTVEADVAEGPAWLRTAADGTISTAGIDVRLLPIL